MRHSFVLAASAALLAAVVAAGCDGSTSSTSTSDGSGGGGASTGNGGGGQGGEGSFTCEILPTTGVVLGVDQILLGETDPDGTTNPEGWKQYGFNVDGMVSDASSVNLCQPRAGATPTTVYPDGDNGIDNAFGKNVLPILLSLTPDVSGEATAAIHQGESTVLIHLEGLGSEPTQNQIPARVYTGSRTLEAPAFDGGDCWPVDPVSLDNPADVSAAKVSFPQSLLVNNEWSTGSVSPGPLAVRVIIGGVPLALTIHQVHVLFDMAESHDSAINGQLGGVLDTEELAQALREWAGAIEPELCEGTTIESVLEQVRQASDILLDGTQDPGATCNAISIGLGFTMARVGLGSIAPATPPMTPCAP